ncbi:hypothetical protein BH23BAC4_BH23BAC4_03430 [soil metagenome]
MRLSPLLFLVAFSFAACSSTQEVTAPADTGASLDVRQPPSGSLSSAQLDAVAIDIRRLEARPLAAGSDQARRHLMTWIMGSPDVSVTLCQGVNGPLLESESHYRRELFAQFILSSAAHKIENPDADELAVNAGGLEGALAAYRAIMGQQGSRVRDSFMESVAERSESGSLAEFVRSGLSEC